MITRFVEVTDGGAYGKFLVCRLDADDLRTRSAMPEAGEHQLLMTYGGRRKFNDTNTFVIDLQTGEGAAWELGQHSASVPYDRAVRHGGVWICPLHLPFLKWLAADGRWARGQGDITEIPRYIDLRQDRDPSGPAANRAAAEWG